jgi:hypothetical protein
VFARYSPRRTDAGNVRHPSERRRLVPVSNLAYGTDVPTHFVSFLIIG